MVVYSIYSYIMVAIIIIINRQNVACCDTFARRVVSSFSRSVMDRTTHVA